MACKAGERRRFRNSRMPHLIWTPEAVAHVQRLHHFLACKNAAAARSAVKSIRAGVRILAQQPNIGRPIDDLDSEFREWLIDFGDSGYVALYRYDTITDSVYILAFRHQKEAGY